MVIKLMKREFRDSARSFVPVMACILLGSILLPIQLNYLDSNVLGGIISFVLVVMLFSVMILTVRASIYVLYTNLYNQSGYELFTLPVKLWQIMVSKILTLMVWFLGITIVSYVGFFIMFLILSGDISLVFAAIGEMFRLIGEYGISVELLLFALHSFITMLQLAVLIFLGGSIANSSYFTKRRGWWTFLFVMLISWVLSFIGGMFGMSAYNFINIFAVGNSVGNINVTFDIARILVSSLYELTITGFLFMATLWMWDRKLEIMN